MEFVSDNSRFIRACKKQQTDATPIWLMRQAGRYMASYRALREKHTLLELVKTPELAAEVTMQPIHAFDLDAAIIFSDILPLLEAMGLPLAFLAGEGPHIERPVRSEQDIGSLIQSDPRETLSFTLDAIRLARRELDNKKIPLIGFSGAPFTLACYAIEGGGSKDYRFAKTLMYSNPEAWQQLMRKLSAMIVSYLQAQIEAGVHAIQIFDSWAGALSPRDFSTYVAPHVKHMIETLRGANQGIPIIYFSTGTGTFLNQITELHSDVVSVDWRTDIKSAQDALKPYQALQGNLDPTLLFAPWDVLKNEAAKLLDAAKENNGKRLGYIFNLGHGILQHTPEDNIKRLVDFVHEYSYQS